MNFCTSPFLVECSVLFPGNNEKSSILSPLSKRDPYLMLVYSSKLIHKFAEINLKSKDEKFTKLSQLKNERRALKTNVEILFIIHGRHKWLSNNFTNIGTQFNIRL